MSEPFTPQMITDVLRSMSQERLEIITPAVFQTWPTRKIVSGKIIKELISNERARRNRDVR